MADGVEKIGGIVPAMCLMKVLRELMLRSGGLLLHYC